jgi:hypothetical protein
VGNFGGLSPAWREKAAAGHRGHEHTPRTKTSASTHSHSPTSDSGGPAVCPHHHHRRLLRCLRVHMACRVTVCPSILCWTKHYPYARSTTAHPINHYLPSHPPQILHPPPRPPLPIPVYQALLAAACLSPDRDHAPLC